MDVTLKGPWSKKQIDSFLQDGHIPMRLACVAGDGAPRVVSVWYGYDGTYLRCVSHSSSQLVAMLRRDERVGFEVAPNEPPYYGVRGHGIARLDKDSNAEVLTQLCNRYLGSTDSPLGKWLLSRSEDEVLITVEPQRLFSWDYRERMQDS